MRKLVLLIATGAGSGYAPVASGTFGSLVGLLLALPLLWLLPGPGYALCVLGVVGVGVWAAERAEQIFERKDDGRITIDEVAGMMIAMAFLPQGPGVALTAFLLFRALDIWKPFPARAAERLRGGMGVMADDVVAGVYANLGAQLIWRVALRGGLA